MHGIGLDEDVRSWFDLPKGQLPLSRGCPDRRLLKLWALFSLHGLVSWTANQVVIDHAAGLHEGIADGGADKFEPGLQ